VADRNILVDTDAFVWLTRGKQQAAKYLPHVQNRRIVLSFASVAELWRGAFARGYNEDSRNRLAADIAATIVVQPTDDLTREWRG
jgi:predicted nucleic acid-binding protein